MAGDSPLPRAAGRVPVEDSYLELLHEHGLSTARIGRLPSVRMSQSAVHDRLKRCGALDRRRAREAVVAGRIVELYRQGMSARQIAASGEVAASRGVVLRVLREAQVPLRDTAPRADVDDRDLVQMYEQDRLSVREIAGRVRMTCKCVHRRLVRAGARLRPPGRPPLASR